MKQEQKLKESTMNAEDLQAHHDELMSAKTELMDLELSDFKARGERELFVWVETLPL